MLCMWCLPRRGWRPWNEVCYSHGLWILLKGTGQWTFHAVLWQHCDNFILKNKLSEAVSCFINLNFNPSFHQHQSSLSSGWCWLLSFLLFILMYYLSTVLYFSATAPDDSLLSIIKKINLALVKTYSFLWILVLPLIIKEQCLTLHFKMNSALFAYREFYTGCILCNMCDSKVDKNWN